MDPSNPFYKARRALFLSSTVAPFTILVRHPWEEGPNGVTIQNLWVDGSNDCGLTVQNLWVDGANADTISRVNIWQVIWKPLWRMTRVVFWLVFISDRSVASSSMHFPYKYQRLPFSFLHFQLKHIVRAQPSSLSETTPFILLYQPSTHSLRSLDLFVINLLPLFIQKIGKCSLSTSPVDTFYFNLFS